MIRFEPSANAIAPTAADWKRSACSSVTAPANANPPANTSILPPTKLIAPSSVAIFLSNLSTLCSAS